jgi:hypothetical protein
MKQYGPSTKAGQDLDLISRFPSVHESIWKKTYPNQSFHLAYCVVIDSDLIDQIITYLYSVMFLISCWTS